MADHTPTPWVVSAYEGGWTCIREYPQRGSSLLFKLGLNVEENATRACACVNAFHSNDGRELPTEAIEPGLFWEMRDTLELLLSADPDMPTYGDDMRRADALLSKLEPQE